MVSGTAFGVAAAAVTAGTGCLAFAPAPKSLTPEQTCQNCQLLRVNAGRRAPSIHGVRPLHAQQQGDQQYMREAEAQYWNSLSGDEIKVQRQKTIGFEMLKQGQLEESIQAFNNVLELSRTTPYLWQRGLVLYYMGRYQDAADQLQQDIAVFEERFEESATDERIWQAACLLHLAAEGGADPPNLPALRLKDPNRLRTAIYELFRGSGSVTDVQTEMTGDDRTDFMGRRFFGDFYLGLWHDARGEKDDARAHMLRAANSTFATRVDLWYHIPKIHAKLRKWQ